jgi:hypothetical protein
MFLQQSPAITACSVYMFGNITELFVVENTRTTERLHAAHWTGVSSRSSRKEARPSNPGIYSDRSKDLADRVNHQSLPLGKAFWNFKLDFERIVLLNTSLPIALSFIHAKPSHLFGILRNDLPVTCCVR